MSLRQALKSKFRSEKSDMEKEMDLTPTLLRSFPEEDHLLDDIPDDCPHQEKDCTEESCSACYELQLAQLQEQLVAVMLENQQLVNEIRELKNQTAIDQLAKQLEKEKEKNRLLSEKLHEKESISSKSPRLRRFVRKEKHSVDKLKSEAAEFSSANAAGEKDDNVELLKEVADDDREQQVESPVIPEPSISVPEIYTGRFGRLRFYVKHRFSELLEDFTETVVDDEDSGEDDQEGDPLTVRKLKENLVRFSAATKPVSNLMSNMVALLRWNSPGTTLLAFCVYMYTMYHGWLLPVLFFLATCQLLLNYIRGWFSGPHVTRKQEHDEGDMGVSDKFQLVLHVARKVQNQLGHMANCLEKIKNLMLWQQPDVTAHLLFMLFAAFVACCVFPSNQLLTMAGLYMGVKLFIIDYIFHRFPRVQQKHDTTARMWKSLPTDAQLERKHNRAELDKGYFSLPLPYELLESINSCKELHFLLPLRLACLKLELVVNPASGSGQSLTIENQNFCELFNLPPSETPLPAWHGGRRCTLINKDKSLTAAFKNGRLYLTNSFLCFERSKSFNPKNLVLPLKNISKVEKAKPYPWLPGGGMAIEISMDKSDKAYIFAAILNRDETLDSIIEAGHKGGLVWATHVQEHEELAVASSSTKKPVSLMQT